MPAQLSNHRPPPPRGRVTFVFTDLVGHAAARREVGDDAFNQAVLEPHNERIRSVVQSTGGYEFGTAGDSFCIAYDTVGAAVQAAVAIQGTLTDPPITVPKADGSAYTARVRIGVHTSTVDLDPIFAAGADRADYLHTEVCLAGRVQSIADQSQILVNQTTHQALGEAASGYQWRCWPRRWIKSFDEPWDVHELLWDGQQREEPGRPLLPAWAKRAPNVYVSRPALEDAIARGLGLGRRRDPRRLLVTLHGYGGSGKTRLAVETVVRLAPWFDGRICLVSLENLAEPSVLHLAAAIGGALEVPREGRGPDDVAATIAAKTQDTLLLLDTWERADGPETREWLHGLLDRAEHLYCLCTSRTPVGLADVEFVTRVEEMQPDEAGDLFFERARQAGYNGPAPGDPGWTRQFEESLGQILDVTDRYALPVKLVAARTPTRGIPGLAAGLVTARGRRDTMALPNGVYGPPDRHRSVTLCLEWSLGLLSDEAGEAFVRLGVLVAPFDATLARMAADIDQQALDELVTASLLHVDTSVVPMRYDMLTPVRDGASDELEKRSTERADLESRLATACIELARARGDRANDDNRAVLEILWPHALRAVSTLAARRRISEGIELLAAISNHVDATGRWAEALAAGEALARRADRTTDAQAWAAAQETLGTRIGMLLSGDRIGNLKRAIECYGQALEIFTREAAPFDWAMTQNNLGNAYSSLARHENGVPNLKRAIECYGRAIECYGRGSKVYTRAAPFIWAAGLNNLGGAYGELADHEDLARNSKRAIECYGQALQICTRGAAPFEWAMTQHNLGVVYRRLSGHQDRVPNLNRAIDCFEQALEIYTRGAAPFDWAMTQNSLGNAYSSLSGHQRRVANLNRAIDCFEQALEICTRAAAPFDWAVTQNNLGNAYCNLYEHAGCVRNLKRAIECHDRALEVCTPEDAPYLHEQVSGNREQAERALQDARNDAQ